jgi:transketolase
MRFLSVDAVQQANSGHPGIPLGAAAMAYVLWTRRLKHNPRNPDWFDRDHSVLSAGHGSMLLYGLLYDFTVDNMAARARKLLASISGPPTQPHQEAQGAAVRTDAVAC